MNPFLNREYAMDEQIRYQFCWCLPHPNVVGRLRKRRRYDDAQRRWVTRDEVHYYDEAEKRWLTWNESESYLASIALRRDLVYKLAKIQRRYQLRVRKFGEELRARVRCRMLKEELMAAAWHPDRVQRWIDAGVDDMMMGL